MPSIPYDTSPEALFNPQVRETLYVQGQVCTPVQIAVEAARLAYLRFEQEDGVEKSRLAQALSRIGFGAPSVFHHAQTNSQAFGAYRASDRLALVAFRGTQADSFKDILTNLLFLPALSFDRVKVHSGFKDRAQALLPAINQWLAAQATQRTGLLLAGHSLGAALATVAASSLPGSRLITIGSPQVGNAAFGERLQSVDCLRIVNHQDIVCSLPLPIDGILYSHVGTAQYLSADGLVRDAQEGPPPAPGIAGLLAGIRAGTLFSTLPRPLTDHAPINYIRAFF